MEPVGAELGAMPLLLAIVFYVLGAYVLSRVGAKFGVGSFGEFLIPIYNAILVFKCAGMSGWHVLWYFVPVANIIISFVVWGKIFGLLGKNVLLFLILFFLFAPIPVLIAAFDSSQPGYRY